MSDLPFQKCTLNVKQLFDDETYMEVKREAKSVKMERLHDLLLQKEKLEYMLKCKYGVVSQRKDNKAKQAIVAIFIDYNDAVTCANGGIIKNDNGDNIQCVKDENYLSFVKDLTDEDKLSYKKLLSKVEEEIEILQKELNNE